MKIQVFGNLFLLCEVGNVEKHVLDIYDRFLDISQVEILLALLQEVSVQAQYRHRQLDYEQLRYTMLAFLVNTEAKLKQWTKKLTYQEEVQAVLNDYNVSVCVVVKL